ncbi:hypothetical protein AMTRI_Chr10g233260 [Amborella trichopoda]
MRSEPPSHFFLFSITRQAPLSLSTSTIFSLSNTVTHNLTLKRRVSNEELVRSVQTDHAEQLAESSQVPLNRRLRYETLLQLHAVRYGSRFGRRVFCLAPDVLYS